MSRRTATPSIMCSRPPTRSADRTDHATGRGRRPRGGHGQIRPPRASCTFVVDPFGPNRKVIVPSAETLRWLKAAFDVAVAALLDERSWVTEDPYPPPE